MENKTTSQMYNELKDLWKSFEVNHIDFESKGNKSAASRARKALGEIKKYVTAYRKESVNEVKGM